MIGRWKVSRRWVVGAWTGVCLTAGLGASCRRVESTPSPAPVEFRLTLTCLGPRQALLAVGDRLPFALGLLTGPRGDWQCEPPPEPGTVQWSSAAPAVATVSASGEVRGLRPGRTAIRAAYRGHVAEREVRVLAAVGSLIWLPPETTIVVGDTAQLEAVARDSAGVAVERLLPLALGALEEQAGELVAFDPAGGVLVRGTRPGRLLLVAALAHRADTAVVIVQSAPPR
jgi:hypothetical protein